MMAAVSKINEQYVTSVGSPLSNDDNNTSTDRMPVSISNILRTSIFFMVRNSLYTLGITNNAL